MSFLNVFIFSYFPYIAIFIFVLGSIFRYENNQYSWKSSSSQLLNNKLFFLSSNFFHFGILFLMFGHFFGLLTPHFIYSKFITAEHKQLLAMISGGIAGFFCFIGLTLLIYRRIVNDRVNITSNFSDIYVLFLLYIQLVLGLFSILISYSHIDNPSTMISLANWVQGIFTFSPNLHLYVISEHFIFKAHLFLGMLIFVVFPFTRLVHIFSVPYLYFIRSGYQIVRVFK
ncbi:MAG TPA: respiratory nitrate reductase subunit gamma [Candidatus Azoamicus sp.]